MKFREKQKFFTVWPPAQKQRNISGWVQRVKWCLHTGQQMPCWQKVAAGTFWSCFACPKLGDADRTRVASKNKGQLWAAITWPCRLSTPLCHTCSEPSEHEELPSTTFLHHTYSKIWGILSDFRGREPRLYSEFSHFQTLSVFSNFSAWNHIMIVCHRYGFEFGFGYDFNFGPSKGS